MLPKIFILCSTDPYGSLLGSDELSWHRTALFVNEEKIWPRSAKNLEEWRVAVKVFPSLREFRKRFLCFFSPSPLPRPPPAVPYTHLAGHYGRDRPTEKMVESESVETFQEDVKWRILYSFGLAGGMQATTQGTTIKEQEQHYIFIRIHVLGPKLFFVTGLVIFVTPVARLVCPDLLG